MNTLCPFPLLSVILAATWIALAGFSPAGIGSALVLALAIPRVIAPLLKGIPGIRSVNAAARLVLLVAWDIVVANITVARLVLGPVSRLRPGFVRVPLAVTHPHAVALFASIVSIVPGSVSIALTPDARVLLLHVLHVEDDEHFVAMIKTRYEKPLMEILEC
jgi:multicomponent K+:H+ antiporter subunit E